MSISDEKHQNENQLKYIIIHSISLFSQLVAFSTQGSVKVA